MPVGLFSSILKKWQIGAGVGKNFCVFIISKAKSMDQQRLQELLDKFAEGRCTKEEMAELEQWYDNLSTYKKSNSSLAEINEEDFVDEKYRNFQRLVEGSSFEANSPQRIWNIRWVQVAAGLALFTSLYFLIWYNKQSRQIADVPPASSSYDIVPGESKAFLTLAGGERIRLDNTTGGIIAKQGGSEIRKVDSGRIEYKAAPGQHQAVLYNMVSTPLGGQYQIILPDGSQAWLNAGSSIRYPTAFIGNERNVEVTGEVYLEVAKKSGMPFKVMLRDQTEVEVLGTHFDINAYDDEGGITTTLLEGSVKVSVNGQSKLIRPGQQATSANSSITVINVPDVSSTVAWKDGLFHFDNTPVESVMRQIGRWYNIEVTYKGTAPIENLTGRISRNTNLSTVLELLHSAGIKFEMKRDTIIINR
ncbi:FecR family protein [Chitinophaga defluvii]|uniref:FecR domain-containing protein n=1 Tax=Chitinophaga defluvii TaxID=3163343 RepID=A0ABV2T8S3_9BACT